MSAALHADDGDGSAEVVRRLICVAPGRIARRAAWSTGIAPLLSAAVPAVCASAIAASSSLVCRHLTDAEGCAVKPGTAPASATRSAALSGRLDSPDATLLRIVRWHRQPKPASLVSAHWQQTAAPPSARAAGRAGPTTNFGGTP